MFNHSAGCIGAVAAGIQKQDSFARAESLEVLSQQLERETAVFGERQEAVACQEVAVAVFLDHVPSEEEQEQVFWSQFAGNVPQGGADVHEIRNVIAGLVSQYADVVEVAPIE